MKRYWISFLIGILLAVLAGTVWLRPVQPPAGEEVTLLTLRDDRPDLAEESPILTVQIEVTDQVTGEAIEAVTAVGYATVAEGEKRLPDEAYTGRYVGAMTQFGLTGVESGHAYYLLVTAEGYEPWAKQLTWQANRSVTLEIPVQLQKREIASGLVQIAVSAVDQVTGQPVTADYFLYRQMLDTDLKVIDSVVLACERVERCELEDVPFAGAGYEWRVRVEGVGYLAETVSVTTWADIELTVEMTEGGEA